MGITIRTLSDKATICLLKNLALKGWQAAANAFLKVVHEPTREDFLIALNRPENKEFREYCKFETILEARHVYDLAAFSNTFVMKETDMYLSLFAVHVERTWKVIETPQIPLAWPPHLQHAIALRIYQHSTLLCLFLEKTLYCLCLSR